jgi:hypothetical protein
MRSNKIISNKRVSNKRVSKKRLSKKKVSTKRNFNKKRNSSKRGGSWFKSVKDWFTGDKPGELRGNSNNYVMPPAPRPSGPNAYTPYTGEQEVPNPVRPTPPKPSNPTKNLVKKTEQLIMPEGTFRKQPKTHTPPPPLELNYDAMEWPNTHGHVNPPIRLNNKKRT